MFENESVDFDYEQVDENLNGGGGELDSDGREYAIQAINRLFDTIFNKPTMQENYLNFVALVYIIRPDLIEGKTVRQLANELGIPKSPLGRRIFKIREKIDYEGVLARPATRCEKKGKYASEQFELNFD